MTPPLADADLAFSPAPLLGNRHAQTIWPALFRWPGRAAVVAEAWETPDGDVLDVDVMAGVPGRPVVLVLHGLEGSSTAPYVRGVLAALAGRGFGAVALNFRSCGPTPPRGGRLYHSGDTRDLPLVVERIRQRWPGLALGAIGFSMGGNVLLKWLGELAGDAPIAAAVAVSVPFDLAACAAALDGPGFWPALYRGRFLRTLRRKALAAASRRGGVDPSALARCRTFTAFDDAFTAPANGFASAADYWARSSSAPFLPRVRRPALIISAEDDPFVPAAAIPRAAIAGNPALGAWITARGGHVGFVAGSPLRPRYAVEAAALRFLSQELAA